MHANVHRQMSLQHRTRRLETSTSVASSCGFSIAGVTHRMLACPHGVLWYLGHDTVATRAVLVRSWLMTTGKSNKCKYVCASNHHADIEAPY